MSHTVMYLSLVFSEVLDLLTVLKRTKKKVVPAPGPDL